MLTLFSVTTSTEGRLSPCTIGDVMACTSTVICMYWLELNFKSLCYCSRDTDSTSLSVSWSFFMTVSSSGSILIFLLIPLKAKFCKKLDSYNLLPLSMFKGLQIVLCLCVQSLWDTVMSYWYARGELLWYFLYKMVGKCCMPPYFEKILK